MPCFVIFLHFLPDTLNYHFEKREMKQVPNQRKVTPRFSSLEQMYSNPYCFLEIKWRQQYMSWMRLSSHCLLTLHGGNHKVIWTDLVARTLRDRSFYDLRTPRSAYRLILRSLHTSIYGFWGSKTVQRSVGWQYIFGLIKDPRIYLVAYRSERSYVDKSEVR